MAYLPFPSGTLLTFAGSTAPDGWLLCDGSAVSRTTYARLFAAISTTYGNGDGALTFNIPDLRGVYPRGAGTNGTANYGGVTGHTPAAGVLATKGGQKTAKNGLANSGSNTVSGTAAGQTLGTTSASLGSGSAASNGVAHTHGQNNVGVYTGSVDGFSGFGLTITPGYANRVMIGASSGYFSADTGGASATNHTHSVSGSTDITHSHASSALTATTAAPTITGDTETTPAFLAVNYIIKL